MIARAPDNLTLPLAKEVFTLAENNFQQIATQFGEGRTGGYIYVSDAENFVMIHACVGNPEPEKQHLYMKFSSEKPERLRYNVEHISSWQSRNPDASKYGGAVRLPSGTGFLSFSGLPEKVDEAFVTAIGHKLNLLQSSDAHKIAEHSDNQELISMMIPLIS